MTAIFVFLLMAATDRATSLPSAGDVVERMLQAETQRTAALSRYSGVRRYVLENKRFNKRAEISVRVVCTSSGAKSFSVIAESGSRFIRDRVIRKMMDAETEASQAGERTQSRILPQNYDFRLLDTELVDGRRNYVLQVLPKTQNRFLFRGRIWVDAEDYAVARVEGSPAKNPSLWTRDVQIVQRYAKIGPIWLPVLNRSRADVRIFGRTDLTIEYFDYVVNGEYRGVLTPVRSEGSVE